ncbi:MAG TPA: tRNA (adenosine(37)-N6)-threonylcarbamoyltransferase complex ATPase subunit type 1 TsaE [Candidatus Babeliales bacterium]|jgi:tRNA threonylcarbamoyladenosine biosynthesis protein TsaE|nr:tRNA (adenosine(37)-N6)-threonylcarbamoyltransferase complex ATPase subunit type 1 TsaE [Candidatus Babeliales bacterium]
MHVKEIIYSLDDHEVVIKELKKLMPTVQVFALSGPLGAGKTTTIKALLRSCGVTGTITSPTFTYVNEYSNDTHEHFYHFDLYRIESVEQFQAQGFDEYLYCPNSWAFIEWPEVIKPLLTHNVCWVTFDYHDDQDKRVMKIECE